MDEPTLDCTYCGHPAIIEVRLERLNDRAEWYSAHRWSICGRHLHQINTSAWTGLEKAERLVVMHLF